MLIREEGSKEEKLKQEVGWKERARIIERLDVVSTTEYSGTPLRK